jgi:membrane protein implicated in regulation of membrane protease activity
MITLTADVYHDLFGGSALNLVYAGALLVGAIYALFLLFFHGVAEGLLHVDLDLDGSIGDGLDHDAGSDVVGISMLAIASFISSFGASGLIAVTLFDAGKPASMAAALFGGLIVGILAQMFFVYILSPTVSSEVRQASLIGIAAEITTPIPLHGVGQIAFIAEGSRMTYAARAVDTAQAIQRGTPVRVERIVGGVAYVSPID